jgi:hypothetical protein
MMKQEIKQRWIEALRSGEYKQGQGCLHNHNENTFCCLGVLCDLHAKETNTNWVDDPEEGYTSDYLDNDASLPDKVLEWSGLERPNPLITRTLSIAIYNDQKGYSFDQLADLIEKHL